MPLCYRNSCKSKCTKKNKKYARADQLFFPSFQPVLALLRAKKKNAILMLIERMRGKRRIDSRKKMYLRS